MHTDDEVRAWFRRVFLLEGENWVADDVGLIALLVPKDDWIAQLHVHQPISARVSSVRSATDARTRAGCHRARHILAFLR